MSPPPPPRKTLSNPPRKTLSNPPRKTLSNPPPPRYVSPPPLNPFLFLSPLLRISQNFPQASSSETIFGGSPKMVSSGHPRKGFALRCVLTLPLALPSNSSVLHIESNAKTPLELVRSPRWLEGISGNGFLEVWFSTKIRMSERGGKFKGGNLHSGFGGFDGFGGSGEHLALLLLVL